MDKIAGNLFVGTTERNEVVINIGQEVTGHILFSPKQARNLAKTLIKMADRVDAVPAEGSEEALGHRFGRILLQRLSEEGIERSPTFDPYPVTPLPEPVLFLLIAQSVPHLLRRAATRFCRLFPQQHLIWEMVQDHLQQPLTDQSVQNLYTITECPPDLYIAQHPVRLAAWEAQPARVMLRSFRSALQDYSEYLGSTFTNTLDTERADRAARAIANLILVNFPSRADLVESDLTALMNLSLELRATLAEMLV